MKRSVRHEYSDEDHTRVRGKMGGVTYLRWLGHGVDELPLASVLHAR